MYFVQQNFIEISLYHIWHIEINMGQHVHSIKLATMQSKITYGTGVTECSKNILSEYLVSILSNLFNNSSMTLGIVW